MPLAAESSAEAEIAGAAAATAKAEADLAARRASVERAEIDRARALDEDAARADTLRAAETAVARCGAESAALRELLSTERIGDLPPIVDSIDADPGFETALGAALGDDLSAPLSDDAPLRWRSLPPLASSWPLPGGVVTLARHVRAPEALTRRLSQIGLAADAAEGARLQPILLPGQRLVTRDGGLWRWDGYSVASGTPTAAAVRLKQRNRLTELESERMSAESGRTEAAQRRDAARVAAEAAIRLDREAREAVARALDRLAEAKMVQSVLSQRLAAMASRLSALSERADRLKDDRMEAEEHLLAAETILVAIGDLSDALAEAAHRRAEVADGRVGLIAARAERDRLVSAQDERRRRLTQIDADRRSWHDRSEGAVRRIAALTERRRQAQSDLERLSTRPAELAALRAEALDSIQGAEAARNIAGDALAAAEAALADADRRLRNAERDLAESRESRVRSEAAAAQAEEAKRRLAEEIRARLEIPPERVLELADLDPEQAPSAPEELAHKHERLVREREAIGPVNLRAEDEMRELDQQIEGLKNERNDLVQAISRLRHGIYELNREGRERLLASFDKVNDHFSSLFTRLFGGGKAFLKLTDSDDPLEAGLEIMASPPGTRMQILSLLSGGETTLTALALLFAVFLTNPAPICVLDEADAALDDANVDRFCTLLDDIVKETGTRFIVITHHRMTMARMDRLYGVTMAERGVSQLVTVDLRQAEAIAGAA
jgi:chromosome segregation protein